MPPSASMTTPTTGGKRTHSAMTTGKDARPPSPASTFCIDEGGMPSQDKLCGLDKILDMEVNLETKLWMYDQSDFKSVRLAVILVDSTRGLKARSDLGGELAMEDIVFAAIKKDRITLDSMVMITPDGSVFTKMIRIRDAVITAFATADYTVPTEVIPFYFSTDANGFLSNFAPYGFEQDGTKFSCAEQYLAYHKIMFLKERRQEEGDVATLLITSSEILKTSDPKIMKGLGNGYKDGIEFFRGADRKWHKSNDTVAAARFTDADKTEWEKNGDEVMRVALALKFQAPSYMADRLIATHPSMLEERTSKDSKWGSGSDGPNGPGENRLGKMLVEVRDRLRVFAAVSRRAAEM
jgi:ribA/ribD-fused uncharacterized protein